MAGCGCDDCAGSIGGHGKLLFIHDYPAMNLLSRTLLLLFFVCCISLQCVKAEPSPELRVDWRSFLHSHDLVWKQLPTKWEEAPYFGNGNLGSMLYFDKQRNALRLQVFRVDVQDHRDNTHGWTAYSRPRLMIGSFYLTFEEPITGCDWRLDLYDAALRGTISTTAGEVGIQHYVHTEEMVMETFLDDVNSPGFQRCSWSWEPERAETTRKGYPRSKQEIEAFAEKYGDHYRKTLKVFEPNPSVKVTKRELQGVSIQNLLAGGQYAVAWKESPTGNHSERHIVSIEKTFPERTAAEKAQASVEQMTTSNYHQPPQEHLDWWHNYYRASFVSIPDTRLESFYWHQMYKMACATRPGRPMMDTAGPWIQPTPWPYITWDLNVQLCYWPVCASNRLELGQSLVDTLHENRQNLIENVRPVEWQADSAYIPVVSAQDLIEPRDGDMRYYDCVGNLPWAMHNVWMIWRYSMDDELLREKWLPLARRGVNLYRHMLIEREDGTLHLSPTYSPEYGGVSSDCNYDLALLRWTCGALLDACERLDIKDPLIPEWKRILANLADFPTDENGFTIGANQPFARSHRHYSHLLMAYPLYLVNAEQGGAERELIQRSLKHWVSFKNALAGYSYTGAASLSCAVGNGNDALDYLKGLERYLQPNGLYKESGPVMETPLSAAQSIHDMLLQSWGGTIRVFPAVPDQWQDITFHDLRTEGAFLVSAVRKQGKTKWVRIKSLAGEPCRIRPGLNGPLRVIGSRDIKVNELEAGLVTIDLQPGEEVIIHSGDQTPSLVVEPVEPEAEAANSFGLAN